MASMLQEVQWHASGAIAIAEGKLWRRRAAIVETAWEMIDCTESHAKSNINETLGKGGCRPIGDCAPRFVE